jgi:hypothetical protein
MIDEITGLARRMLEASSQLLATGNASVIHIAQLQDFGAE